MGSPRERHQVALAARLAGRRCRQPETGTGARAGSLLRAASDLHVLTLAAANSCTILANPDTLVASRSQL